MARIILPSVPRVAPSPGPLHLGDEERAFFDSVAVEQMSIAGTPLDYYALDRANSIKDPLYNEASERIYAGPFRVWAYISDPESTPEVRDEGVDTSWTAKCWIPRKVLDDAGCPVPNEGDVIVVWNTPFHEDWSAGTAAETPPGSMYAFDCTNVNDMGHLFDNSAFIGYEIDVKRRTFFTPERRIDGIAR